MWNQFLYTFRSFRWQLLGATLALLFSVLCATSCSSSSPGPTAVSATGGHGGASGNSGGASGSGGGSAGASQCPVGSAPCNGACVNPATDAANCGACATVCGTSQICTNSACSCPPGAIACGQSCINPMTDALNCGGCGMACKAGESCAGTCQCQSGLMACMSGCSNVVADGANCGKCGTQCPTATPFCSSSQCVATCPSGQSVCGTGCVDATSFQSDALNCGKCGNACAAGQACTAGSCGCPANHASCNGACVDTSSDIGNCGTCGMACTSGTTCSAGKCGCSGTQQMCGTQCTDTQSDAAHCGACTTACTDGQTCSAGKCSSGGSRPAGCPAAPALLSDFEEGTGVLVPQTGRTGWWYVYNDSPTSGSQTPATSNGAIAAALLPQTDTPAPSMCNKYGLHSTASGHPMYVGFGATFIPGATPAGKTAYSLAAYTGVSFRIRSGSGNAPPIWFEFLNKETQPGANCPACGSGDLSGTAKNPDVDAFNTRGRLLSNITSTWQTVTIPFATLAPRYLPGGCASGVLCEAPAFNPASALGFQLSLDAQFDTSGSYDLWVDDVTLTTGDAGLPTPPAGTGKYTFPQDKMPTNGCLKPTGATGKDLVEAYQNWKATFVTNDQGNLRVKRPENNNDSVSEGIAYGMLIAVYMNDKTLFDGLWAYWKAHPSGSPLLMTWQIPGGSGSATDADEDAAFALIQASKQWDASYLTDAKSVLAQIRGGDIESGTNALKPGNSFGGSSLTNPSYFAPAYYRVFAGVDTAGTATWNGVVTSVYGFLKSIEGSNGLVPAWCQTNCTARGGGGYADADKYQYDSHRTPWRMGLDVCWNGNTDAKDYVTKTTSFFSSQSDTEGLGSLVDLYDSMGKACSCSQMPKANSMSLIGTAAAGAMATGNKSNQVFLDRAWQFLLDANYTADPTFRKGTMSAYTYYNATVGLLTALTLSGNFNSF